MVDKWVLTYFGVGYLSALGLFGPAIFSAILRDLVDRQKISRVICNVLLLLQGGCYVIALLFVISFVVRSGDALGHPKLYEFVMMMAGLVTIAIVIWSSVYLNKMVGRNGGRNSKA